MKYSIILFLLSLSYFSFGQTDTLIVGKDSVIIMDDDSVNISILNGRVRIKNDGDISVVIGDREPKRNVRTRWILMDLGFDNLASADDYTLDNGIDPFELNAWKSTNVNLHVFQQKVNLINHAVNLKWGLTFQFHKYMFDNNVTLQEDAPQATFLQSPNVNYDKTRLATSYLTMPLMLNFETNPKQHSKSLHISFGGYGGPRLGANFKTKVDGDKDKVRDDFNLSKWRYGIRTELGFGPFNLYATIPLNELFQEGKNNGYKVTPFSVGFIIIPF